MTDYSKADLIEILRGSISSAKRHPIAIIGTTAMLAAKLFRKPLRRGPPFPFDRMTQIEVREIPEDVSHTQEPLIKPLAGTGFAPVLALKSVGLGPENYTLVMRSSDGLVVASVAFIRVAYKTLNGTSGTLENTILTLSSERSNGTIIATTITKKGIRVQPEMNVCYLVGASAENVIARHRDHISHLFDIQFIRREELPGRFEERTTRFTEFQISRGIYVPATEEELRDHGLVPN